MREITIEAEQRTAIGKKNRSLRTTGMVPGIFYLHGEDNLSIAVAEKQLKQLIYTTETHIINLKVANGQSRNCILRSVQFDPVTERPLHFDLQGVRENEEITVEVPVAIIGGTPVGVRDGGILQQFIHRLKISCLPKYIPEHIEINAEALKINQFVHVRDLKVDNITLVEHESSTIVGIVPPTVEKEEAPAVAVAEAAEPEVIAKGKKPEEGAEAPAGEKKAEAAAPAAKKEEKK